MTAMYFIDKFNRTLNESRLNFQEMWAHKQHFPVNIMDLDGKRALVWPKVADNDKGKCLISDP
jgi:hypothetical protein